MKLNATGVKGANPKEKPYRMVDGGGLYLEVRPNGSKYWRLKYRYGGKEKCLALGVYPFISLSEARDGREKAKKLLEQNIDPSVAKKKEQRRSVRNAQNTFKVTALEWHENQLERWSKNHANNVMMRLERDVFPYIGSEAIADIEAPDILDVIRKIEKRGSLDVAGRTKQICGQVFRYGIITGKCIRDPSADLRGALKTRKTKHFAALDIKEIPAFLEALERNDARLFPRTRRAIKFSMLTFVRPGELREAVWDEIDFDDKEWLIPARRMKMDKDHISVFHELSCGRERGSRARSYDL